MRFLQTDVGAEPVLVEAIFPATPQRVFKAWTDPDEIMKWFGPGPGSLVSAEVDLRPGGAWCFVVSDTAEGRASLMGAYTIIEPAERLQFTWQHVREHASGGRDETPFSTVTISFEPHGAATRVKLRHEGILKEDGRKGVGNGWETTFGQLEAMLLHNSAAIDPPN
ncbi:MAG: SRPBCC domain-containing protein [Pseudomonadota bacterium]